MVKPRKATGTNLYIGRVMFGRFVAQIRQDKGRNLSKLMEVDVTEQTLGRGFLGKCSGLSNLFEHSKPIGFLYNS